MAQKANEPGTPETPRPHELMIPIAVLWLAFTALLLLLAAGLGSRAGLWHFRTGFNILTYGGYCGVAASLAAFAGIFVSVKRRRILGLVMSIAALAAGLTAFAVPFSWKLTAGKLPRIHDITTDTATPPSFVAILPLRKDAPNPVEYGGPEIAVKQLQAYPDLKTLIVGLPPEQTFPLALDAATRMGWEIVAKVPAEGRIEATDTTFWFGFKDDIVIRITPAGNRSLLDVRSVSRVGVSDVGTNARRIRAYLKMMEGKG